MMSVDRATVERVLQECYDELDRTATVHNFLTASAGNWADNRLRALAIARGAIESSTPRVLFVCDLNAGRSQMGASLIAKRSNGRISARSAGVEPAGSMIDTAVQAMAEIDVPLENAYPKSLTEAIDARVQTLIRELDPEGGEGRQTSTAQPTAT